MKFLHTLADILSQDTRQLKLVTVPLALATAVGFAVQSGHDPYNDLRFLMTLMPWECWSGLCVLYGVSRIIGLFFWRGNRITQVITPMGGMFLWAFLLASSAIISPMEGMSLLYIIPALIEALILGRFIDDIKRGVA